MPVIALAGVELIVVALVGLLLAWGAPGFVRLFQAIGRGVPFVGGAIASVAVGAFNWATSGLIAWTDTVVGAVSTWVWGVVSALWSLPASIADTAAQLVTAVQRLRHDASTLIASVGNTLRADVSALYATIGHVEGLLSNFIAHLVANLQRGINAVAAQAAAEAAHVEGLLLWFVKGQVANLQHSINTLTGRIDGGLAAISAQAGAEATAALHTAEADIAAASARAAHDLSAAVGGLESYATTTAGAAAATLAHGLDQAAHDVVSGPWEVLLPGLGAILTHLPTSVVQALPGAGTLPQAVPVSLPGVLSILSTGVAAIGTEVARCVVPQCDNLSGLSDLLGQLEDDAFLALLLALVAEAATHPAAAVQDLTGTVAGPVTDLAGAFRSLVGA